MPVMDLSNCNDVNYSTSVHASHAPFTMIMENPVLEGCDDDSDSDNDTLPQKTHGPSTIGPQDQLTTNGLKPGKKTKGRVKIKMEFIENKLRRYTTFSKRKTGIMKKAYELSTLTGTQVMLLVASETGHVYTFATRKLQPMITSHSGKNLIQTCLNSPEDASTVSLDQRMNPTGYEEMEFMYAVPEDDLTSGKNLEEPLAYTVTPVNNQTKLISSQEQQMLYSQPAFPTLTSFVPTQSTNSSIESTNVTKLTQAPYIVSSKDTSINQSTILTQSALNQAQGAYSLSTPNHTPVLSIPGSASASLQQAANNITELVQVSLNVSGTSTSTTYASSNTQTLMTPSIVMYQTPQGIVYATPGSAPLPGGSIFNFQQPAHALSNPEPIQQGTQYITIPVPMTLAGSSQLIQLAGSVDNSVVLDQQVSPAKKVKK